MQNSFLDVVEKTLKFDIWAFSCSDISCTNEIGEITGPGMAAFVS